MQSHNSTYIHIYIYIYTCTKREQHIPNSLKLHIYQRISTIVPTISMRPVPGPSRCGNDEMSISCTSAPRIAALSVLAAPATALAALALVAPGRLPRAVMVTVGPGQVGKKVESFQLVGGIPTPLKNMKVNRDDYSQYMEKKKGSKPLTSQVYKEVLYNHIYIYIYFLV